MAAHPTYPTAQAFQGVLQQVLSGAQGTAAARALADSGLRVGFSYTDPELFLALGGPAQGQQVAPFAFGGSAGPEVDVTFHSTADTGHRFWMGDLSVPTALALGQIKATGSLTRALALLPLMPELQALYRAAYTAYQDHSPQTAPGGTP